MSLSCTSKVYEHLNNIVNKIIQNGHVSSSINDDQLQTILHILDNANVHVSDTINPPIIIKTEYFTAPKGVPTCTIFYAHLKLYENGTYVAQIICDNKQIPISNESFQQLNYAKGDFNKVKHIHEILHFLGNDVMDIDNENKSQYVPVSSNDETEEEEEEEEEALINNSK